jgi:hypothetical protein
MITLVENPMPAIVSGLVVAAVLAVILVRTGRGAIFAAMGVVLALTGLAVLVEWLVVTERERVEAVIYGGAAAVEANDHARLKQYLAPEAAQLRNWAGQLFRRLEFTSVRLSRLEIRIIRHTSPPTAKAEVSALVSFQDRLGEAPYRAYPAHGMVELRLIDDQWLVTGYTLKDGPWQPLGH